MAEYLGYMEGATLSDDGTTVELRYLEGIPPNHPDPAGFFPTKRILVTLPVAAVTIVPLDNPGNGMDPLAAGGAL